MKPTTTEYFLKGRIIYKKCENRLGIEPRFSHWCEGSRLTIPNPGKHNSPLFSSASMFSEIGAIEENIHSNFDVTVMFEKYMQSGHPPLKFKFHKK